MACRVRNEKRTMPYCLDLEKVNIYNNLFLSSLKSAVWKEIYF